MNKSERHQKLLAYHQQIKDQATDLEIFARLAEFVASTVDNQLEQFMLDLNYLILNAANNWLAIIVGVFERSKYVLHSRHTWFPASPTTARFGSSGFAADDHSNQVQHFWYFVAVSYKLGPQVASFLAWYHEWNPPKFLRFLPLTGGGHGSSEDLVLSDQGLQLGRLLATGDIQPDGVASWLRNQLSPDNL